MLLKLQKMNDDKSSIFLFIRTVISFISLEYGSGFKGKAPTIDSLLEGNKAGLFPG